MTTAWDLHRAFPEAEFVVNQTSGHSAAEVDTTKALVGFANSWRDFIMQTRPASVPPMVQGVVSTPTSEISPGTAAAFGTLVAMWVHLTAARARGFPLDACRPLVIPLSLLLLLLLLLLSLLLLLLLLVVVVLLLLWLAASTFVILMDDTDALRCFLSLFFFIFILKKR